jgi:hypothetical protein
MPTATLGVVELLEIVTLPDKLPAVGGTMATRIVTLWPAAIEIGTETLDSEKPKPLTVTFEIVSVPPPEFLTVTSCPSVTPIPAVPKFMLPGETAIVVTVAGDVELAPVIPMQPVCAMLSNKAAAKNMKTNGLRESARVFRAFVIRIDGISIEANR